MAGRQCHDLRALGREEVVDADNQRTDT